MRSMQASEDADDEEAGREYAGVQARLPSCAGKRASIVQTHQRDSACHDASAQKNATDGDELVIAGSVLDDVALALETATSAGEKGVGGVDSDISNLLLIFQESLGSFNVLLTSFEQDKEEKRRERRRSRTSGSRARERC